MSKIATQVLEKFLTSGKKVVSQTLNGKTFTSIFDEAGNLLKTRVKHFKEDAICGIITRYTTEMDFITNSVTNGTAKRKYSNYLRLHGKNPYVGTQIVSVTQQLDGNNLLSSKSLFKHPNGQIGKISSQWTPFDFSSVHHC